MIRRTVKFAISAAIATAFIMGVSTVVAPVHASFGGGHCICTDNYDPVTCSNGVTYSNSCQASCAHATGCVPANTI